MGQDEAAFKLNAQSRRCWAINGSQELRQKGDGPAEMTSCYQDEYSGFGLPMSTDELKRAKQLAVASGLFKHIDFTTTPAVQYLLVGTNNAGMNKGWGGKQRELRDSIMTAGCLGTTPKYDRPMTDEEIAASEKKKNVSDDEDDDGQSEDDEPATSTTPAAPRMVEGWMRKPKGVMQILYERGLYKKGMVLRISEKSKRIRIAKNLPPLDSSLDASFVLSQCEDFQNERGVLRDIEDTYYLFRLSAILNWQVWES
eukprot:gene43601-54166_t